MARILLADDSQTILKMITHYLTKDDHEIVTAADGREAFDIFCMEKGTFDIVITDINMPNMNGLELTEKIRNFDFNKSIPVIVLSTEESDKIKDEGKKAGVSAWIVKPPREDVLLKTVRHFIKV
jgi:two-component system chemotaxis response regulator CheY